MLRGLNVTQFIPIHNLLSYLFNIQFHHIVFFFVASSFNTHLYFRFYDQNCTKINDLSHTCYGYTLSISFS